MRHRGGMPGHAGSSIQRPSRCCPPIRSGTWCSANPASGRVRPRKARGSGGCNLKLSVKQRALLETLERTGQQGGSARSLPQSDRSRYRSPYKAASSLRRCITQGSSLFTLATDYQTQERFQRRFISLWVLVPGVHMFGIRDPFISHEIWPSLGQFIACLHRNSVVIIPVEQ